ncbi:MAG: hypothetical protein WCB51_08445 [Candidatus Dormiibacterota bacterium]
MSERVDELLKGLTDSERQELAERMIAWTPRLRAGTVEERVTELEQALYSPRYPGPHHHHHHHCGCPWQ